MFHHAQMMKLALLTTTQMALADRLAIESGIAGIELMEHAGAAVADVATELVAAGTPILVLCGPGNNGGDGFIAARILRERGFPVRLALLGEVSHLKGDAAEAARRWGGPTLPSEALDFADAGLVVDGLFGAGLDRDLTGSARQLVEGINRWRQDAGHPVLAIDVPSGLDGNTGAVRGAAVRASATVTFFRFKPGHLLFPGRALCGEPRLAQIGTPESVLAEIAPRTFANAPDLWLAALPVPKVDGHKYSRGHALIVSGHAWTTGAARLTARAALRSGAGLVTLASPREALVINAAHLTSVMLTPCDGPAELAATLADPRKNAVAIGPGAGVGEATAELVLTALQAGLEGRGLVLDADALTSFSPSPRRLAQAIEQSANSVIMTPHDGEFGRLFNEKGALLDSAPQRRDNDETAFHSKLERVRQAAVEMGATVLLKGPDTVVAHPDGRASIAFDSPPWLATAGSGDVLTGLISGLLAQGMPPFEAASAAVWMHGSAGRTFGPGLIAEDLPEVMPAVLRDLYSQSI